MPLNILLGSLRKQPFQFRPFSFGFILADFRKLFRMKNYLKFFQKNLETKNFLNGRHDNRIVYNSM